MEVLNQPNAYLLTYVHMRGEEVAGEGSRQPHISQSQARLEHDHAGVTAGQAWSPASDLSAGISHGLQPQDAESLDGNRHQYAGSEAGSSHPSDASSTMSVYEQDFADMHPRKYAAMTAEERADVKRKGKNVKKRAQQKASRDRKKQCGLAEAAAKGAAKHPASGNSDATQPAEQPAQTPGHAFSRHQRAAVSRLASAFNAQPSSSQTVDDPMSAPPAQPATSNVHSLGFWGDPFR